MSNDKYATPSYAEARYSETSDTKKPHSKKSREEEEEVRLSAATDTQCENQVDSIDKVINWISVNVITLHILYYYLVASVKLEEWL